MVTKALWTMFWFVLIGGLLAVAAAWAVGPVCGWLVGFLAFVVLFIHLVTNEPVHLTSLAAPNDPNASTIRGTGYRYVPGVGMVLTTMPFTSPTMPKLDDSGGAAKAYGCES